jgi:hypothetical protein
LISSSSIARTTGVIHHAQLEIPFFDNPKKNPPWAGGVAQVVEHLPSKCEALSSVLEIDCRVWYMLGKLFITELHLQPFSYFILR